MLYVSHQALRAGRLSGIEDSIDMSGLQLLALPRQCVPGVMTRSVSCPAGVTCQDSLKCCRESDALVQLKPVPGAKGAEAFVSTVLRLQALLGLRRACLCASLREPSSRACVHGHFLVQTKSSVKRQ